MKSRMLLLIFALMGTMATTRAQYPDYPGGYDPTIGQPAGGYGYADESGYYGDDDQRYGDYGQRVQLALLLDASGSMDQLIDQARAQLWSIVNGLWWSYDDGYQPRIEIAVYAYGSTRFNPREGYMQLLVPFTEDLDWVSDELYNIRTGGRMEYAGWVIQDATRSLRWSTNPSDVKLLYLAGNEHVQQGPVNFRQAISEARQRGITVNTLYCGPYNEGISRGWEEAARYGGGTYSNIDLNGAFEGGYGGNAPVSYNYTNIYQLNVQLNNTYVPYGAYGQRYFQRLQRQDQYVGNYGQWCLAQRTLTKASGAYHVYHWDLVAAYHAGHVDLNRIPVSDLPPNMRGMSIRERQQYLIRMQAERARIHQEIRRTARRPDPAPATAGTTPGRSPRTASVAPSGPRTLDQAIVNTTREQVNRARTTTPAPPARSERVAPRTPVQRFDSPQPATRPQAPANRYQEQVPATRPATPTSESRTRIQPEPQRNMTPVQPTRTTPVQTRTTAPVQTRSTPPVQTRTTVPVQTRTTPPVQTRSAPQEQRQPAVRTETRSSQPAATPAAPTRRVESASPAPGRSAVETAPDSRRPSPGQGATRR